MAGDWIKIEENMPDKPEVCAIASTLGIDPDAVAGKLLRVWAWASRNCDASGVTSVTVLSLLDRTVGVTGFCDAMKKAGWLVVENGKATFPNFNYHMSQSAKERALTVRRMQKNRLKKCYDSTVTSASPEKRREEKNTHTNAREESADSENRIDTGHTATVHQPPTLTECVAQGTMAGVPPDYCRSWYHEMTAQHWLDNQGRPMAHRWANMLKKYWENEKTGLRNKHEAEPANASKVADTLEEENRKRRGWGILPLTPEMYEEMRRAKS